MPLIMVTCADFSKTSRVSSSAGAPSTDPTAAAEETVAVETEEMRKISEGLRMQLAEKEIWIDDPTVRESAVHFFEELAGSQRLARIILAEAVENDVPAPLAFALVWAESSFDPYAVNENTSSIDRGLFQLNSRSFPGLEEHEFFDPEINAEHGLAYLSKCLGDGGNEVVALAMYNAGKRRVHERGTPRMTLDYIAKVLDYRDRIEGKLRIFVKHVEEQHVKANTPNTPAYVVDSEKRSK